MSEQLMLELGKLLLQFLGALGIAWLTVQWALGRYKAERTWERETAALADLLAAIGELDGVNSQWLDDEYTNTSRNEEYSDRQRTRYFTAKAKLESMSAVAAVVLPDNAAEAVDKLLAALNTSYEDFVEDLESTDVALQEARASLVAFGKTRVSAGR